MTTPAIRTENTGTTANGTLPADSTKLALFDLDGVLFDTLAVMRVAWDRVRAEYGFSASFEDYADHLGRPFDDILGMLGLDLPQDSSARVLDTYQAVSAEHADLAVPCSGVVDTLCQLDSRQLLLGVVTSKPKVSALPLLDRLGCEWTVIRTPGSERGKPAPDSLLLAVTDVGVDPREAVYVGDMSVDQQAADRAGIPYLHASWGYGTPATTDAVVLSHPQELITALTDPSRREVLSA
ncbi:HAD family hydrolase [Actinophytocola sp.]|uniref:HAD family hydrolase n=1 Tax=Actinophytocola sp. TaxID=1872138 RepID=UPI003D6BF6F8